MQREIKFINRFGQEEVMPQDHTFDLKLGDVCMLNGRLCLITGYGVYDHQYWTEQMYEDGIHLAGGGYEKLNEENLVNDAQQINIVKQAYIKAITENYVLFLSDHMSKELFYAHIQSLNS